MGELKNSFLTEKVFQGLRSFSGKLTNLKFKVRGEEKAKNKILIIAIDDEAITSLGSWPWPRTHVAKLIDTAFNFGAKVVGLDMVFSEAQLSVTNEDLRRVLLAQGKGDLIDNLTNDVELKQIIAKHQDRLVIGFANNGRCQPAFDKNCATALEHNFQFNEEDYPDIRRFAFDEFNPEQMNYLKTPIGSFSTPLMNLPMFREAAKHNGFFAAESDSDGIIRRNNTLYLINGIPYPSLALTMAKIGLNEQLGVEFDNSRVKRVYFKNSGREIPTTPLGLAPVNFRGGRSAFPTVGALNVLLLEEDYRLKGGERENFQIVSFQRSADRQLASSIPIEHKGTAIELFKDAYVFIAATAIGVYDIRHFPFESGLPGVDGHAHILDNYLSGDSLTPGTQNFAIAWMILIMLGVGLLFAYYSEKLESKQALLLFIGVFFGFGFLDFQLAFAKGNSNWTSVFFYVETFAIFVTTFAAKYILEEKDKKFIKGAFGKFVSPAVVEKITQNPESLALGGEKRNITILFSDIRSFTTLSEKMDPKMLSSFLNEYLGDMTEIIKNTTGTLDKYIGDAVMAFWGAPIEFPQHAEQACQAAIRMQQAISQNRQIIQKKYGVDISVGIGLNTGIVSVGNMGSKDNMAYTALGDHVNLASRLEGLTKEYGAKILCSQFTLDQIKESGGVLPPVRQLDSVKVKGKKEAVPLFQILDCELKEAGLKRFDEARQLYLDQNFDEAIQQFEEVNQVLRSSQAEDDGPSMTFISRAKYLREHPPGPNWDGAWTMKTK